MKSGVCKEIYNRCCQNGFNDIQLLGADALKKRENHITGVAALYVPSTGIVSYANVAHAMAEVIEGNGGRVKTGDPVNEIREDRSGVTVTIGDETVRAKYLIACAGLMADRIARLCSLDFDFRIIPFRGEFYCLPSTKSNLVKHLIYPIPDPTLPFLGVHLTPTIDDNLIVGPNAVLAFNREGYRRYDFNARDILDMVGYRGFWKLLRTYLKPGIKEYWSSLSRRRYLKLCQKYCPILKEEDLQSYPSGVRAQAVLPDGTFPDDFLILNTPRTMHVCNAPSPAATSSIPIGQYLASKINTVFNLGKPHSPTT